MHAVNQTRNVTGNYARAVNTLHDVDHNTAAGPSRRRPIVQIECSESLASSSKPNPRHTRAGNTGALKLETYVETCFSMHDTELQMCRCGHRPNNRLPSTIIMRKKFATLSFSFVNRPNCKYVGEHLPYCPIFGIYLGVMSLKTFQPIEPFCAKIC